DGVLVVPGLGDTMVKFAETLMAVHAMGYSCYIMDHHGQGLSGRLTDNPRVAHIQSFGHYVEDLLQFQRLIPELVPAAPVPRLVIAHSMGCLISLQAHHQAEFERLVLLAPMLTPHTRLGKTKLPNLVCGIGGLVMSALKQGERCVFPGQRSVDHHRTGKLTHDQVRIEHWVKMRTEIPWVIMDGPSFQWLRESIAACYLQRLKESPRIPILVVEAGQDVMVRGDGISRLVARSPDSRYLRFEEAYHDVMDETPDIVEPLMQEIARFLRGEQGSASEEEKKRGAPFFFSVRYWTGHYRDVVLRLLRR
ncbi:unnamed protein product, partial [Chrysoparadoxa australica]